MKLSIFNVLIRDVFNEYIWNRIKSFDNILFILVSAFVLNVLSTIYSLKSIEILKNLMKSQKDMDYNDIIYTYIINTALILSTRYLSEILSSFYIEYINRKLMTVFLRHRMQMRYNDIVRSDSGETVIIMQNKINTYKSIFEIVFFKSVSMSIFIISSLIKMNTGGYSTVCLISVAYPIIYLIISIIRLRQVVKAHRSLVSNKKANSSILYDKIQNVEIVKYFGIEKQQSDEIFQKAGLLRNLMFKMKTESRKRAFIMQMFSEIPFFILSVISKTPCRFDFKEIGFIYMIFKNLNTILNDISTLIYNLMLSLNSLEDKDIEIVEQSSRKNIGFNDRITFRSVDIFHGEKIIISNINLTIKKFDKVAVLGENGTGKSTFIRSLLNFSDYTGEICIDDQNIKELAPSDLFSIFSYVSQDDYISNGSLMDNIKIGKKYATIDEIQNISKKIGLNDEIMQMKDGYETIIGLDENDISPGQKKKISLLRAFIKNSPILILDEATSSVDKNYEDFFVRKILKDIKNKTIFAIIHKKDLVRYFDRVIFLKDGKINDFGSYTEVYQRNPHFKNFIKGNGKRTSV